MSDDSAAGGVFAADLDVSDVGPQPANAVARPATAMHATDCSFIMVLREG